MTGGGSGTTPAPAIQADPPSATPGPSSRGPVTGFDEWAQVDALRHGEESAFVALIGRHHGALGRLARLYVPASAADDLAQDVWGGLLAHLGSLDRAASLRVVLFRLLLDSARGRRPDGAEPLPFAAHAGRQPALDDTPLLDPAYFRASEPWIDHWAVPLPAWEPAPDGLTGSRDLHGPAEAALAALPAAQREVVTLRDVEGWPASEVCSALGIAEPAQRALLHRGRSRIRLALDRCLQAT